MGQVVQGSGVETGGDGAGVLLGFVLLFMAGTVNVPGIAMELGARLNRFRVGAVVQLRIMQEIDM